MKVPALTTDVCRDWHGRARSHPFAPVGPLLSFLLLTVLATAAHSESSSSDLGSGAAAGTASFASHPEVQAYLRYFQGRGRPSMERWLERGERYVPMIRQRLNDAMLPEELWSAFSHAMLFHGRAVCEARKPACDKCVVSERCPSAYKFPHFDT